MAVEGGSRAVEAPDASPERWRASGARSPGRCGPERLGTNRAPASTARGGRPCARADATRRNSARSEAPVQLRDNSPVSADSPGLDADESLAEFRELVRSAGGEVAAELLQRRRAARPGYAHRLRQSGGDRRRRGLHQRRPGPLRSRSDARRNCAISKRRCPAACSTARSSSSTSLPATRAPARASCRWSWRSLNTCCRGSPAAAKPCRSSAAASAPADRAKRSSKPTAARFSAASTSSKLDLEAVRRVRRQQRQRREAVPVPTVALVGYTNAGKSTLFNPLTGAHVLSVVADVCHARSQAARH